MFEKTIDTERIEQLVNLFGNFDENIKEIESKIRSEDFAEEHPKVGHTNS